MRAWAALALLLAAVASQSFTVEHNSFLVNGSAVRLLSSSFHYFRVPRALWADRLLRLKALGVNSVETYVPWNWHEPRPGRFDFASTERDLAAFFRLCSSLNLMVLLRPGPYICAEWEFGGFPAWFADDVVIRTYNEPYLKRVALFWTALFAQVRPFLFEAGGPVVMVQMENEFGSYGNVLTNPLDKRYLEYLVQLARQLLGPNVVLYTTNPLQSMPFGTLTDGSVVSLPDFGPGADTEVIWSAQKRFNPPGKSPRMCTEYYTGWISTWGKTLANTSSAAVAKTLEKLLSEGASMSLYMGFGGSNFGWWNGADFDNDKLEPVLQSYDYDAPVSESGTFNLGSDGENKFVAVQTVLQRFQSRRLPPLPPPTPVAVPPPLTGSQHARLMDNLASFPSFALPENPVFMERLNQSFGYIVYRHEGAVSGGVLTLPQLSDRVHVFSDNKLVSVLNVNDKQLSVTVPGSSSSLTLMVENLGRVNFGGKMRMQRKGLEGAIRMGAVTLQGWKAYSVSLEQSQLLNVAWQPGSQCTELPCFVSFELRMPEAQDLFISTKGWSKGVILVNGFNLGRYWQASMPQKTLYVPACLLRNGANQIVVLETDALPADVPTLYFSPVAVWEDRYN